MSLCTISPCLDHGPSAIWAYLDPVLHYIKREYPSISTLHVFSDGPVTQYRQEHNFYLLSTKAFQFVDLITWNFFEASHRKGAPDGAGGVIKRSADHPVALGHDVSNARIMYDKLVSESTIKLFYVAETPANDLPAYQQCPVQWLFTRLCVHLQGN